ncbi:MAG TPA: VanZ family protein [Phycisphaerales bacterium]
MNALRLAFAAYAVLLFLGTHWPQLNIQGPVPRSDLWVHLVAFGTWSALVTLCGFFGPRLSARNLLLSWILALGYACLDEGLQGIPALGRTCAWDDLAMNACGITLASLALAALARTRTPRPDALPEAAGDGR